MHQGSSPCGWCIVSQSSLPGELGAFQTRDVPGFVWAGLFEGGQGLPLLDFRTGPGDPLASRRE